MTPSNKHSIKEAKDKIAELVERFRQNIDVYKRDYNELRSDANL